MHLLHQQQQNRFICLVFIIFTQVLSSPITQNTSNIRCNDLNQNCTLSQRILSANATTSSSSIPPRTPSRPTFLTSRIRSTTKTGFTDDFDEFSENLKRAALILAGIALGLGILRICLMLCKSRSPNNSLSPRRSSIIRPHIATVEHHQFKPDLPPAYAEAIVNMENDDGKLPTYEELPYEQQQAQQIYSNHGYISTQM
jgi:hypothetical protein